MEFFYLMSQVRCAHILCKHKDSRNPVSRRTGQAVTISKEQAIAEIQDIIKRLKQAPKLDSVFKEIASARSDCSSCAKGGDLGFFGRGQMQKAFEEASFALGVGEISGLVDSDSGIHVVFRIA